MSEDAIAEEVVEEARGFHCPHCDFVGRNQSGLTRHINAMHPNGSEGGVESTPDDEDDFVYGTSDEETPEVSETSEGPTFVQAMKAELATTPDSTIKPLKGAVKVKRGEKSKKLSKAARATQKRLLTRLYWLGDRGLSVYGKARLQDADYTVVRSKADVDYQVETTINWMEYHGWGEVPVTPDVEMAIATGEWFGRPVVDIRKRSGKGLPSIPGMGRFKRWREKRKRQKAEKRGAE